MTAFAEHANETTVSPDARIMLLDLDSTLFDTRRFGSDLWWEIADRAMLQAETVKEDAAAFRCNSLLGGYDFEAHIASYRLNPVVMWQQLNTLLRCGNYLYADAPDFVQGLRADGFEPKILSYGEERIQTAKIMSSMSRLVGVNAVSLDFEVTDRPKHVSIRRKYSGRQGVLVDDVKGQQLPPGFIEVNLDRSQHLPEPAEIVGGFVVSDLVQARQLIASL